MMEEEVKSWRCSRKKLPCEKPFLCSYHHLLTALATTGPRAPPTHRPCNDGPSGGFGPQATFYQKELFFGAIFLRLIIKRPSFFVTSLRRVYCLEAVAVTEISVSVRTSHSALSLHCRFNHVYIHTYRVFWRNQVRGWNQAVVRLAQNVQQFAACSPARGKLPVDCCKRSYHSRGRQVPPPPTPAGTMRCGGH